MRSTRVVVNSALDSSLASCHSQPQASFLPSADQGGDHQIPLAPNLPRGGDCRALHHRACGQPTRRGQFGGQRSERRLVRRQRLRGVVWLLVISSFASSDVDWENEAVLRQILSLYLASNLDGRASVSAQRF